MKRREQLGPAPAAATTPLSSMRVDSGVRERVRCTNLAHAPTRFVGRRREMSELRTLLVEHPLVTVVGAAGIGKSRLANELALAVLEEYARDGGAWRVDLAEARDADTAWAAMARTLGISATSPRRGATAALASALAARGRTLVLLDGADGCVAPLARALPEFIREAPNVRWIVTSRARLGAAAEAVLDVGSLATTTSGGGAPDAVWLFVDRARSARPELVLDERTAQDTLDRVRRVEGIPLAVELDAACPGARAPSSRFDGATDAQSHGTLRTAIEAACRQLDPWQRDALAQLSAFAGGFDADAAAAVLDLSAHPGAPATADVLELLRERGLITTTRSPHEDGRIRFSCPRTVREYARERLVEAGERDSTLLRHARYFVAVGRECADRCEDGRGARNAAAWLARETENLLAVHRRMLPRYGEGTELAFGAALALDALLVATGPVTLRMSLIDGALKAAQDAHVDAELRVQALEARASAHRQTGNAQEAVADAQAALSLATSSGSRATVGRVLRAVGTLALMQGRLEDGRALLERACAIDRETKQRREEGRALGVLGSLEALQGRLDVACSTLQRAIELHREVGDARYEAIDTGNLAVVAHDTARLDEARTQCDRAIVLCRETGDRRLEADVVALLAAVAHDGDRLDEARDLYVSALAMHREAGNRRAEGIVLGYQGALLAELEDLEGARAACARSLAILRECGDRSNEALVLGALAALEAREGSLESARAALARATECLDGNDEPRSRAALHLWRGHLDLALARAARAEGDEARATMLVNAARNRLEETTTPERGEVRRTSDVHVARRALQRAVDGAMRGELGPSRTAPVEAPPPDAPADALVVCAQGRWFRAPHGEVVSMARWRPLQRLLERLAERREIAPGEPISVEGLISAGWPGERMQPKAGATRVYTAVASLRRLGLRDFLVRDERGYLLRTDVPIARVSRR